jgi:hypothetical protein
MPMAKATSMAKVTVTNTTAARPRTKVAVGLNRRYAPQRAPHTRERAVIFSDP